MIGAHKENQGQGTARRGWMANDSMSGSCPALRRCEVRGLDSFGHDGAVEKGCVVISLSEHLSRLLETRPTLAFVVQKG